MARNRNHQQPPAPPPPEEFAPNETCELPELPNGVLPTPSLTEAAAPPEATAAVDRTPEFLNEVIKRRIATAKRERELVLAAAVESFNEEHWS